MSTPPRPRSPRRAASPWTCVAALCTAAGVTTLDVGASPLAHDVPAAQSHAAGSDDTSDDATGSPRTLIDVIGGVPALKLSPEAQREGGVATAPLQQTRYRPEIQAYGEVVELQPLLALRAGYAEAKAERAAAHAARLLSEQAYRRAHALHRAEAIPARRLEEQRSQWQGDVARLSAIDYRLQGIRENALQTWGDPIATWALDGGSPAFQRILDRTQTLLLLSLPTGQTLPEGSRSILVARHGDRARAVPAEYLSPAPRTDPITQGETFFFTTDAKTLRTGMRVDAWVPLEDQTVAGVLIPASAVVWHGGEPWCYVRIDPQHFVRRRLENPIETGSSWFVRTGFSAAETVVTVGAEMLLSEEFRRHIPDEDDD